MEKLLSLLNSISPLSNSLTYHLYANVKSINFSRGDYILKEGEICQHVYFLESGLIRIFGQQDDRENTSWLLKEGDIFISVASFFRQQPADENIVALEDCTCWRINHRQLEKTCEEFEEFTLHRQIITERYYCQYRDRAKILMLKPKERYAYLIEKEPELLARVPLNLLSSYLNLPQRTFNRVRNKYYETKRKLIH
jgi:CRP-like cAMP-binding protein